MGMPAAAAKEWTVEMLETLPDNDGKRYEIIDGELIVSPSPGLPHQRIIWKLVILIEEYVKQHPSWLGVVAPADVVFDRRNLVEPDLFIARRDVNNARTFVDPGSLALAIEVISPSSARHDRNAKRKLYQKFNVPEYWIVDPEGRLIERWRPEDSRPEILTDVIEWQPSAENPPLRIDLAEFFASIHGESAKDGTAD